MKGWEVLVIKTGSGEVINDYIASQLFSCSGGGGGHLSPILGGFFCFSCVQSLCPRKYCTHNDYAVFGILSGEN